MAKPLMIFVGVDGRPSMKKVYSQMQGNSTLKVRRIPRGQQGYIRSYNNHNVNAFTRENLANLNLGNAIIIRWGNRIEAPTNEGTVIYNKSEAVKKATDKKLSRQIFLEQKVRIPRLFSDQDYAAKTLTFPIIARPSRHAKGKNFVILKSREAFIAHYRENEHLGWYYSEFIDKDREFRCHCAHGKILAVMEKPRGNGIAWNRAQVGEPFVKVQQENYLFTACFQALKACKALGLDFGGIDVIVKNNKDGKPEAFVLEANTSPTLNSSDWVSSQYAKYFDWLGRSDKRREHWDFTKFEKAPSFAWKQAQLAE